METINQIIPKITTSQNGNTNQVTTSKAPIEWIKAVKLNFYKRANELVGNYEFDEFNKDVITNLLLYFGGFESEYNPEKGIYLYGPLGSGKTVIMKIIRDMLSGTEKSFRFTNSTDIVQYYVQSGNLDLYYLNKEGFLQRPIRLCIDDLGAEISIASYYGTQINVIQEVLQNRYYVFQDKTLTHITSNLSPTEVSEKYGDRVKDRMREMFTPVILNSNNSRRK